MDLDGKKVILTGVSSGIGRAILEDLATAGCDVLAVSRSAVELRDVDSYPPSVRLLNCDITSESAVATLALEAGSFLTDVDLLINNAGLMYRELIVSSSLHDWKAVLDTNLCGTFLMLKHVLPMMVSRGYGTVVNVGSAEALNCSPGLSSYSASKSGLAALTRTAALEMQQHHDIVIVGLFPGNIKTPMNPTGSEHPSAAVRRLHELLRDLEPRHSGSIYVQGRFAMPSLEFLSD
jgi:NAD(P)-dependent dehydrogenase (short-subunit alcohol dehydrogenase family)